MCEVEVSSVVSVMEVIDISLWDINHAISADCLNRLRFVRPGRFDRLLRKYCPINETTLQCPSFSVMS